MILFWSVDVVLRIKKEGNPFRQAHRPMLWVIPTSPLHQFKEKAGLKVHETTILMYAPRVKWPRVMLTNSTVIDINDVAL